MRTRHLVPRFVTYVPGDLRPGEIYVSLEYATASHLCACGCGTKTVTPLAVDGWALRFDGRVTLRPSIGNGQAPCRSHYFITGNQIEWLSPIGRAATRSALAVDRAASNLAHAPRGSRWQRLLAALNCGGRAKRTYKTKDQ